VARYWLKDQLFTLWGRCPFASSYVPAGVDSALA
jgi:hypothetical protein